MSRFISNNYRLYLISSLIIDILTTMIAIVYSVRYLFNTGNDDIVILLIKIFVLVVIANRFSNFFFKVKYFNKIMKNKDGRDDYYPDEALMEEIIDITEEDITKANSATQNWVKFNLFMSIPAGIFCSIYSGVFIHASPQYEIAVIIILLFTVAELLFYKTVLAKI